MADFPRQSELRQKHCRIFDAVIKFSLQVADNKANKVAKKDLTNLYALLQTKTNSERIPDGLGRRESTKVSSAMGTSLPNRRAQNQESRRLGRKEEKLLGLQ